MSVLVTHLRNKLIAGALAAVPLAVTAFLAWYADLHAGRIFGTKTPAVGVLMALAAVYLLGVFVTSVLGKHLLRAVDRALGAVPGLGDLYRAWKQVALTTDGAEGMFARAVLIECEAGPSRLLGFTTGNPIPGDNSTLCVFVPTSPNPTSGRLYFVPRSAILFLDLPSREALKLVISGGNFLPPAVGTATSNRTRAT